MIEQLLQRDAALVGRRGGGGFAGGVAQTELATLLQAKQRDLREVLRVGADLHDGRAAERDAALAIREPVAFREYELAPLLDADDAAEPALLGGAERGVESRAECGGHGVAW